MLKLNEFILLKAVFNESLHNAILDKDTHKVDAIVSATYTDEVNNGFIKIEAIDIERLYREHRNQIENDNFEWAY